MFTYGYEKASLGKRPQIFGAGCADRKSAHRSAQLKTGHSREETSSLPYRLSPAFEKSTPVPHKKNALLGNFYSPSHSKRATIPIQLSETPREKPIEGQGFQPRQLNKKIIKKKPLRTLLVATYLLFCRVPRDMIPLQTREIIGRYNQILK